MNKQIIFIGVPVYKGRNFIAETLRSILDQRFSEFRVLISVDHHDLISAEQCKPFLSDPRFEMIIHPKGMGWARHFNWLIEQCDCPFFMYWQQDDIASTNYLELLYSELADNQSASVAFTDVQWFGAKIERDSCPGISGNTSQRILQALEHISYIPLRGLMRSSHIKQSSGIPLIGNEQCHAEFPFLMEMAALGSFCHTSKALYFKRAHGKNTFLQWQQWEPWRKRKCWIEMGLGFLKIARRYVSEEQVQTLLLPAILDRLIISKPGRAFFYHPPANGIEEFIHEFLISGNLGIHTNSPNNSNPENHTLSITPIDSQIIAGMHAFEKKQEIRNQIGEKIFLDQKVIVKTNHGRDGTALLGWGWSFAEKWGVWSDGPTASLQIPLINSGRYKLILIGYHYRSQRSDSDNPVQILWRTDENNSYEALCLHPGVITRIEIELGYHPGSAFPLNVKLSLPDSVFLPDEGIPDNRRVGFGLKELEIIRNINLDNETSND